MNFSILRTSHDLQQWRKKQDCEISFVPTMGNLHTGHIHLIKKAKEFSANHLSSVLVSVFVNPLQFGPNEDFDRYPRDFKKDCETVEKAGAQAIWLPSLEDVFPGGTESHFKLQAPQTLTKHLCGAHRKGHFDGVSTVIVRLLTLTQPTLLVLGEKDWQQFIIIRNLIQNLGLSVKIKGVATVRHENGLAYSSRNQFLSPSELKQALHFSKELLTTSKNFHKDKKININQIKSSLEKKGLKVEYVEVVDPYILQPVNNQSRLCLLAAAVKSGNTRLIDHRFLMTRQPIVAIDGPAGAGKSTVTQAFADKLGLIYLDTGAMYRSVTWLIQQEKINPEEDTQVKKVLQGIKIEFKKSGPRSQRVLVNKQDVTDAIRKPEVTSFVSRVAAKKLVREALTAQQKELGISGGIVAEGRDIGTTVFPDADLKIFLTASPAERAKRRANDLQVRELAVPSLKELEKEITERDRIDSTRKISPLLKAEDAQEVITDGMNIEEVIQLLIDLFRLKVPEELWPTPH